MAYFESITAGRGGLDSYNQALNNQRYANLSLNESMGNFANTIANVGSLFDNAKIREDALKYQRMRDLANDKKQAEAFDLQKKQAEQSNILAKRQQVMNEQAHKQNIRLKEHQITAMKQENERNRKQDRWLEKTQYQASAVVGNNAKTPTTTPKDNNALNTLSNPISKPTPTTIEEVKNYINSPFRY
ncbi:hypothetical protein [Helicobacter pylori]|uniref:hypothetical protein n=1 Tax=Helicobacter pylori TaxID=210 RepID=UPI0009585125|nr:hypothetical protein [Helicobacter pylori]BAW36340.1 putative uncharacterized protein [Helicobacter pylori]BAW45548.1 putative uncharacterized protein [Helicobacter pylori]BAW59402.1 putative uncharacterized protein [Helicobacter pylori]BAW67337.1 putative uncharacterized protein [Helicobacter pylori]